MLRSMTGFGSAQGAVKGVEYSVEARSVNNRYFKPVIKLPEYWAAAESEVEKLLRQSISRGTVTLIVRVKLPQDKSAYKVNTAALANYIEQLKVVGSEANPMLRIELGSLLLLPGVCEPPALEEIWQATREGLMKLIDTALKNLVKMRDREGKATGAELAALCGDILKQADAVALKAPGVVVEYHQRLRERVQELTAAAKVEIDAEALAREVAVFAERCDVAEELTRLKSHVEQFQAAFQSPEPAGRKLDFIAQEMLREANTIASKANDSEIAHAVVDMKTAIDRIKEQVQNIE